jgi:putative aldouronate transport system permease protein
MLYGALRIFALCACVFMFFPGFNPGYISLLINRNISLFTTGISLSDITTQFTALLRQGIVDESTFVLLSIASVAVIAGAIACGAGACMSLGNNRMKSRGIWFPLIGSLAMSAGLAGIYLSYVQLFAADAARTRANFPSGFYWYAFMAVLIFVVTTAILLFKRPVATEKKMKMPEKYSLFLMFLPK